MKNPCWKGYEAYGMKKKDGKEVPNCVPVKEELQQLTRESIISNLFEGKGKSQFAKREGNQSQRPKSWDKGTKSGSERRKMREEGKREAREINEEEQKEWPFGWGTDAANKHNSLVIKASEFLGSYGMMAPVDAKPILHSAAGETPFKSHEDIIPVVHRIIDSHAAKTAEFLKKERRTPIEGWADDMKARFAKIITPPKSDPEPQQRSVGRGYHVRDDDGVWMRDPNTGKMVRIAGHDAHDAKNDGFSFSEETYQSKLKTKLIEAWENREQQRQHAPHEDPMVPGGEHGNYQEHDPYPHVSTEHRHSLEASWNAGMKHGYEYAELMAHANLHGIIDAITKMHMPMEGASHEWNAKHAGQGIEKIAQHLEYNRKFLDRKWSEKMKKNSPDSGAGDIPF